MEMMQDLEFSKLPWDDKVKYIDARLGDQPSRIREPKDLLPLVGKTIYLVLSPIARDKPISNCFMMEWKVGKVSDHYGIDVTPEREINHKNDERFVVFHHDDPSKILSLKDFNVVPNNYNNHAIFDSKEAAEAYIVYRKFKFEEDQSVSELKPDQFDFHFSQEDATRLIATENEARRRIKIQEEEEAKKKNGQ